MAPVCLRQSLHKVLYKITVWFWVFVAMFAIDRVTDSPSSLWDGCGPEHRWLIVYDVVSHQSVCSVCWTCVQVNSKKFENKHSLDGNKFTLTESLSPSQKQQYKCLFKAEGLLGMVLVSSNNVWESGSVKRSLGISLQQKSSHSRDGQKGVWVTAQISPMQQQFPRTGDYFSLGNRLLPKLFFSPTCLSSCLMRIHQISESLVLYWELFTCLVAS